MEVDLAMLAVVQAYSSGCCKMSQSKIKTRQNVPLYAISEPHFFLVSSNCHVLLTMLLPMFQLTQSCVPSTSFYTHLEFAHNKLNENESFYSWLRWERWHINEGKTLLRVSERDFSNKRHWEAVFNSSWCCQHINKKKIWLRAMEVEENACRSPTAFTCFLLYCLNLDSAKPYFCQPVLQPWKKQQKNITVCITERVSEPSCITVWQPDILIIN